MKMMKTIGLLSVSLAVFVIAGVHTVQASHIAPDAPSPAHVVSEVERLLGLSPHSSQFDKLRNAYSERNFEPIWVSRNGAGARLEALHRRLMNADVDGLDPRRYSVPSHNGLHPSAESLARVELGAALNFVTFAQDLRAASADARVLRHPQSKVPKGIDATTLLDGAASAPDIYQYLDELSPQHHVYQGLRESLRHYRQLRTAGGWAKIPSGKRLKPGHSHPHIVLVRERLFASGDLLEDETESQRYDNHLLNAVSRFQRRHGLKDDGTIGPQTRAAMNRTVDERIQQILVNMERARWLPSNFGERYILVNVPGYWLELYEGHQVALEMAVIVGKKHRRTPIFSGNINRMELNPYWGVPDSIARNDILPKLKENPSYLDGLRVFQKGTGYPAVELDRYDVDWHEVSSTRPFAYYFRQDPGPQNALGQAKFLFDNPFNVYLHDTPNKNLFSRSRRALSSGCIRLGEPIRMAEHLLSSQPGWSRDRIDQTLAHGGNTRISLNNTLNVHLVYQTVWMDKHGHVQFRPDIYGRDERIKQFVTDTRFNLEVDVPRQAALVQQYIGT
jgi:L,D-transpeptidase YcbB